jgi:hypothetical protein
MKRLSGEQVDEVTPHDVRLTSLGAEPAPTSPSYDFNGWREVGFTDSYQACRISLSSAASKKPASLVSRYYGTRAE